MQPSATWPSNTTVPTQRRHACRPRLGVRCLMSLSRKSGSRVEIGLPPLGSVRRRCHRMPIRPTDRRTDREREQVPVGFCLSRKEAKLNWLKNDGTAAAGASSPLLKTHFQSDLIKTAGGRARCGRANIHNLYMRVKGGRHATLLGEPRGALVAELTY